MRKLARFGATMNAAELKPYVLADAADSSIRAPFQWTLPVLGDVPAMYEPADATLVQQSIGRTQPTALKEDDCELKKPYEALFCRRSGSQASEVPLSERKPLRARASPTTSMAWRRTTMDTSSSCPLMPRTGC